MPKHNQHVLQSLYAEHRQLEMLFEAIDSARGEQALARLFRFLHMALRAHIEADRSALYVAAARRRTPRSAALGHCERGLQELEILALAVTKQRPGSVAWRAWISALRRAYLHHVAQEEQQLFAPAEELLGGDGSRAVRRGLGVARVSARRWPSADSGASRALTLVPPRVPGPS